MFQFFAACYISVTHVSAAERHLLLKKIFVFGTTFKLFRAETRVTEI